VCVIYILHLQGDPVDCYPLIQLQFCSVTVDPFDFQAKILGVDSPLFLHNTQPYFSLFYSYIVSTVKGLLSKLSAVAHLVACLPVAWAM
jgi:hypothetical protein